MSEGYPGAGGRHPDDATWQWRGEEDAPPWKQAPEEPGWQEGRRAPPPPPDPAQPGGYGGGFEEQRPPSQQGWQDDDSTWSWRADDSLWRAPDDSWLSQPPSLGFGGEERPAWQPGGSAGSGWQEPPSPGAASWDPEPRPWQPGEAASGGQYGGAGAAVGGPAAQAAERPSWPEQGPAHPEPATGPEPGTEAWAPPWAEPAASQPSAWPPPEPAAGYQAGTSTWAWQAGERPAREAPPPREELRQPPPWEAAPGPEDPWLRDRPRQPSTGPERQGGPGQGFEAPAERAPLPWEEEAEPPAAGRWQRRSQRQGDDDAFEALRSEIWRARRPEQQQQRRRGLEHAGEPERDRSTRWLRILAVLIWIIVFAVLCWIWIFPALERFLSPEF